MKMEDVLYKASVVIDKQGRLMVSKRLHKALGVDNIPVKGDLYIYKEEGKVKVLWEANIDNA